VLDEPVVPSLVEFVDGSRLRASALADVLGAGVVDERVDVRHTNAQTLSRRREDNRAENLSGELEDVDGELVDDLKGAISMG
jgi:hypothetical protein